MADMVDTVDCFLGEIRIFAGDYAPKNWAFCDGATLSVQKYQALFALLGTVYGGDGSQTFALPDFRGRIPVGFGTVEIALGELFGAESHMITQENMPPHTHTFNVTTDTGDQEKADQTMLAKLSASGANKGFYSKISQPNIALDYDFLTPVLNMNQQPINNMMPTLTVNYIIALSGIYPS
ncbi:MAG: phage tail protein [Plesiomonas sp.]